MIRPHQNFSPQKTKEGAERIPKTANRLIFSKKPILPPLSEKRMFNRVGAFGVSVARLPSQAQSVRGNSFPKEKICRASRRSANNCALLFFFYFSHLSLSGFSVMDKVCWKCSVSFGSTLVLKTIGELRNLYIRHFHL